MKKSPVLTIAILALAFTSFQARAVTEVDLSNTLDTTYDTSIAPGLATDLIYGKVGSSTAPANIDFTIAGMTDGLSHDGTDSTQTFFGTTHFANAYGQPSFGNSLNSDPVVTFNLGTSPTGYTLASIQSIFGYTNESSFADQNFTIQYTTVTNGTWRNLAVVAFNPFTPPTSDVLSGTGATDVTLTGLTAAVGVNNIRFAFSPYVDSNGDEQFGQVIREIEVNGVATPAIEAPEPSTWAMMLLGVSGLALIGFRRKSNS
jgi:hypothetical protein